MANTNDNQMTLDLGDTTAKLTVRDLIVHGEIETPAPRRVRRPRPASTFEVALTDGADCAFRRRCGTKTELLVMLATQGQAYVMDERTGRRRALTAVRLAAFCDGATGDTLTPPWCTRALHEMGGAARSALVWLLADEDFLQMARRDMVRVDPWQLDRVGGSLVWHVQGTWQRVGPLWRVVEPAVGHELAREALSRALCLLSPHADGVVDVARFMFKDCACFGDLDEFLGRDRARSLVRDVIALGTEADGPMGDVIAATSRVVWSLGRHGVEADRGRLCRHVMALLSGPRPEWRARASRVHGWATCLDEQARTRGRVFEAFPEDPRALSLALERERRVRDDDAQPRLHACRGREQNR